MLQTDCQEIATVVSATEIRTVAELLQISPEGLQKAITFKVTVSVGGGHHSSLTDALVTVAKISVTSMLCVPN